MFGRISNAQRILAIVMKRLFLVRCIPDRSFVPHQKSVITLIYIGSYRLHTNLERMPGKRSGLVLGVFIAVLVELCGALVDGNKIKGTLGIENLPDDVKWGVVWHSDWPNPENFLQCSWNIWYIRPISKVGDLETPITFESSVWARSWHNGLIREVL